LRFYDPKKNFLTKKISKQNMSSRVGTNGQGPSGPHWRPLAAIGGRWGGFFTKHIRGVGALMTPIFMAVLIFSLAAIGTDHVMEVVFYVYKKLKEKIGGKVFQLH
jgi:hypothetical protein